jgi:hypothetical protein
VRECVKVRKRNVEDILEPPRGVSQINVEISGAHSKNRGREPKRCSQRDLEGMQSRRKVNVEAKAEDYWVGGSEFSRDVLQAQFTNSCVCLGREISRGRN